MNTTTLLSGLMALCLASLAPLHAEHPIALPPLGSFNNTEEARLDIKVQNCLHDVIVNISNTATGRSVFRKHIAMNGRLSFSLTRRLGAGTYRVHVVPADAQHWNSHQAEVMREVELAKGKQQTVSIDLEENRPADRAPLPTDEQIDKFCQGDTQALQDYLGAPNSVLLVYVYEVKLEPNPDERMRGLYGLIRTTKVMVMQSTDPKIKAGERLEWTSVVETQDKAGEVLGQFQATPFEPELMYIINPHLKADGKLSNDTGFNLHPMKKRRTYHYLRASHSIQGISA